MKTRFLLPVCLFAALAFPVWGAILLEEGFDGMEKGKLPKGWECSVKTPDYYTNEKTYPTQPCLTLGTTEMTVDSRTFPTGATNVSFTSYTANNEGECNKFKVYGWVDGQWSDIGEVDGMAPKAHQTFSLPISDPRITRVRIQFIKTYNASLDDILVEGPFSVTFDRKDGFQLPEGTGDAITATANYDLATPDTEFDYAWSGDLEGSGDVLEIPDDLAPGTYEVTCTATVVGDEETHQSNTISFRVLAFHDITVGTCEHGSITASTNRAVEGTVVRVAAEPESEAYGLLWIVVNGENQPRGVTEFKMPDTNVVVTAVFKLYEVGDLVITFDGTTSKNPAYASTEFESDGVAFRAVQCQGGDEGAVGYEGDKSMRLRHTGGGGIVTNGFFATAGEMEYPAQRIYFEYKAYSESSTHLNKKWSLETSTDGSKWTTLATVAAQERWGSCNVATGIPENSFYFRIISANAGTTARMALFDNIHIWYGTPTFRVKLSGVKPDDRVVCDDDNPLVLTATGLDGTEPYEYAWRWTVDGGEGGTAEGDTCEFSETGAYEVEVTCTDGDGAVATASVSFTLEKQYRVICPAATNNCLIVASTNKAFAGDTVTVEVKPKLGYTLDGDITATSGGETVELDGNSFIEKSFVMPAGDVEIAGAFRLVRDAAALPFEHHGPWQATVDMLDGVNARKIGTDYDDKNYDGEGNGAAKFGDETSIYQIHFDGTPEELSYMIRGNSLGSCICTEFLVWESADGTIWTAVTNYPTEDEGVLDQLNHGTTSETFPLRPDSRYVKFGYKDMSKGSGSIGIDAIVITKGEGAEPVEVRTTYMGDISFADGTAKWAVSLEPEDAAIAGSDIWAASDLVEADWHATTNATVEESNGKYLITVKEGEGNFISVGKPIILKE
jgi:hypothetical protein